MLSMHGCLSASAVEGNVATHYWLSLCISSTAEEIRFSSGPSKGSMERGLGRAREGRARSLRPGQKVYETSRFLPKAPFKHTTGNSDMWTLPGYHVQYQSKHL